MVVLPQKVRYAVLAVALLLIASVVSTVIFWSPKSSRPRCLRSIDEPRVAADSTIGRTGVDGPRIPRAARQRGRLELLPGAAVWRVVVGQYARWRGMAEAAKACSGKRP